MKIIYDEDKDILVIQMSDSPTISMLLYGKQVNVKLTKKGIGQITIREAKATGFLPLEISSSEIVNFDQNRFNFQTNLNPLKKGKKKKKKCCKSYKKGKRCKSCPKEN